MQVFGVWLGVCVDLRGVLRRVSLVAWFGYMTGAYSIEPMVII